MTRPSLLWITLAAMVLPGSAGLAEPTTAPTAPGQALSFSVKFDTEDGFELHGDLTSAADTNAPVVILLHMYRSDRKAWAALVPKLAAAGLTVLALDQRAHGESTQRGDHTVAVESVPRDHFDSLVREGPRDVAAALAYLAERGLATERLALVGASYGCTVSLLAAQKVPKISALVLLSPGSAYFGVDVVDAAQRFSGPMFLVAAEDDPRAADSARKLAAVHAGPDELLVYPSGGHGTRLFAKRPELLDRIVTYLRQELSR